MLDIAGTALDAEDRELLCHPAAGGVILFSRNYESPAQLSELTSAIHALREPPLLIGVDQEGGRVQRFRDGFTRLPPAARFGRLYETDPGKARLACESVAWLMAVELRAVGVDFSFAPVLDLDRKISRVIGDRGFGHGVRQVCELTMAWAAGVRRGGMAAVGKHFPGHGGVVGDSHTELPTDPRSLAEIEAEDLVPFCRLMAQGLEAVMPAHVVYPCVDSEPAGFSSVWLRDILRGRLGFAGVIFSDDLNMAAAEAGGDYPDRARAAAQAGCDILLICNNRPAAVRILEAFRGQPDPGVQLRLLRMHGRGNPSRSRLRENPDWQRAVRAIGSLEDQGTFELALTDPTDPDARRDA